MMTLFDAVPIPDAPAPAYVEPPRTTVDVSRLGGFEAIVITESGGTIRFASGDLLLSAAQTTAILKQRNAR